MDLVKTLFGAALCLGFATAAHAEGLDGRLQVKVGVAGVLPNEDASISVVGGDADISDEWVPAVQLEYFLTDHVSAELLCCMARHDVAAVDTALGRVDLGKISHFPPTVTLKYRWTNFGNIEPYVGAGVNYTTFFDEELPSGGPITSIDYDDSFGGALQTGVDIRTTEHWFVNLDARYIWINTDVSLNNGAINADVDINPWVLSASVGYRF